MKIKVYNDNGNIKITKVIGDNVEQTLFGSLLDGEVAEINVEVANLSVTGEKRRNVDWKAVEAEADAIRASLKNRGIKTSRIRLGESADADESKNKEIQ